MLKIRKTTLKITTANLTHPLRRLEVLLLFYLFIFFLGGGEEEGRVIKVNKGKSFAVGSEAPSTGKSLREEKTTVHVNGNKASALRAQLGAKSKK